MLNSPSQCATPSRRNFIQKGLLLLTGCTALPATCPRVEAAFGPASVPTTMSLSVTSSARLSQRLYVTAVLRRLDGRAEGLSGMRVAFWAGNPTYPTTNLGTYVTNANGTVQFNFAAANLRVPGNYVLIADVGYNPSNEGWVAAPRPYAWFTVTR